MSMLPISRVIDLICVFAAITSLNTAITGNVYSAGRRKRRLVATVKSMPVRVALLCTVLSLFSEKLEVTYQLYAEEGYSTMVNCV
jgi:hypothetical protein